MKPAEVSTSYFEIVSGIQTCPQRQLVWLIPKSYKEVGIVYKSLAETDDDAEYHDSRIALRWSHACSTDSKDEECSTEDVAGVDIPHCQGGGELDEHISNI